MHLWVITDNHQYRLQKQKLNEEIQLTFELPNGEIKHFKTDYQNLLKMMESSDKSLYSPIS